jgi:hypothetical protein
MDLHPDLIELLKTLSASKVKYLIVGAHAVAFHGHPRFTKDLGIWVEPTQENAHKVWSALRAFGAPLAEVKPEDFANPNIVYQMGVPPHRFDILVSIEGVRFQNAWPKRVRGRIADMDVYYLGREHLIRNKKAVGRPQDLIDVEHMQIFHKFVQRRRRKR